MAFFHGVLALCCLIHGAQGIAKSTLASSDPHGTTMPWLLRYFPVYSSNNSCDNGNKTCECGAAGRMEVNGTSGFEPEFGIHTVLAEGVAGSRSKTSGQFTVAEIEAIWDEEIGDLSDERLGYSHWLDNHVAFWTPSMAPFVQRFEADGHPFKAMSWQAEGSVFYSLIVHAPKTQMVFEIISNSTGGVGRWPLQSEPRHFFQGQSPPDTKLGYIFPLHVSRAVRNLDEIRDFYSTAFDISPRVKAKFESGSEVLVFGGVPNETFSPRVALQFVKRPQTTASQHSAEWFQAYMLNVSKTYMTSYNSCWPVWGDNHISVRATVGLEIYKARFDSLPQPMYHAFRGIHIPSSPSAFGGPSVIYVVDPSGWTVQVGGHWPDGFLPDMDTDQGNFYGYCGDPEHGQGCRKQDSPYFV